jgi:nitroimidazol reductase NimA-like FMN-containing flavoprotein (pyridoxamine 5'-phosphate oxidase superfamily)
MTAWSEFAEAAPGLADFGERRLEKRIAYLATIRKDGSPRVHPVSPFLVHGQLYIHMEPSSPKRQDLLRDGRYALHCAVEDYSGGQGEFMICGQAREVPDPEIKELALRQSESIGYQPKARYVLFELSVEEARSTIYPDDAPLRESWKAS